MAVSIVAPNSSGSWNEIHRDGNALQVKTLGKSGTVLASAARTASTNSDDITVAIGARLGVFLDVTAASGVSPTLDVVVKAKDPASGKYFTIGTFTQATGVTSEALWIGGGADVEFTTDTFRVETTIAGTTPSFTFSVGYASSAV